MSDTCRVVVGVSGSLNSLTALHRAADEARRRDALLVPVLAWEPPGGESAYRRSPCPPLLAEAEHRAVIRLDTALEQAFAGFPPGPVMRAAVVRGPAGPALVEEAAEPGDLLVVSGGRRTRMRSVLPAPVPRYCLRYAACPVFVVPPSDLLAHLGRATLRRVVRGGASALGR